MLSAAGLPVGSAYGGPFGTARAKLGLQFGDEFWTLVPPFYADGKQEAEDENNVQIRVG